MEMEKKERKLVTFEQISSIRKHENADNLEIARVLGWDIVVRKGDFHEGEKCVYFSIDSFLPIRQEFEFLRATSFKKMDDCEGFRLRTLRLRGEISQGLLLPLSVFNLTGNETEEELTKIITVKKYEPPIPAELSGVAKGTFPSFIPKTDQERVQNLIGKIWGTGRTIEYTDGDGNLVTKELPPATKRKYELTEKLDGSSTTYYNYNDNFGVCSRNYDLEEDENNTFWKVALKYDLKNKLKGKNVALQGELIGEGVQGNPYKLKGQDVYVFDIYLIDEKRYMNPEERTVFLKENIPEILSVPLIAQNFDITYSLQELLEIAQGYSLLNPKQEREGLVFKEEGISKQRFSFKVLSNKFLLNQKD